MDKSNESKDWASDLINNLLTTVNGCADGIPEGFQLDGVNLQRYTKGTFNITFSFKQV